MKFKVIYDTEEEKEALISLVEEFKTKIFKKLDEESKEKEPVSQKYYFYGGWKMENKYIIDLFLKIRGIKSKYNCYNDKRMIYMWDNDSKELQEKFNEYYNTENAISLGQDQIIEEIKNFFNVEKVNITGDIVNFPVEIVQVMLIKQFLYSGECNIAKLKASKLDGFVWSSTSEGYRFWDKVIRYNDYRVFYDMYPFGYFKDLRD